MIKRRAKILSVVLVGFVALVAMIPARVAAKGAPNVSATVHNLSTTGVFSDGSPSFYRASDNTEVCVYCHTPHGGSLTGPLWNRNNPTGPWTHYSSTTMSAFMKTLASNRAVNDESLLCMSCHDGSISVNHVINVPNALGSTTLESVSGSDVDIISLPGVPMNRIGASINDAFSSGDLSDDHPISFSYDDVEGSNDYQIGAKAGQLNSSTDINLMAEGPRFATRAVAGMGTNRVECTTCHDPHVYYTDAVNTYKPFLIMSNAGSNLCLACHVK